MRVDMRHGQDLEHGLILLYATSQSEGYAPIPTLVVSVPESVDGLFMKLRSQKPVQWIRRMIRHRQSNTVPSDSKLPQTGQLWWPVPVLAIVGIVCVL